MSVRKTTLSLLIAVCLCVLSFTPVRAEPQISGKAAVLIDSKSGEILFTYNADTQLPPASLTKILTAIIALEKCKMTDTVTAGKNPTLVEPSMIGIKEGETFTMETLLYSLLIKSANDAAVAIAEHIAGSVPEFARMMNNRARELGATGTNFVNPNGLTEEGHYTTARDMALIARHAMTIPEFRELVTTKVKIIPRADDTAVKWLQNHNKMLWRYEGANGVKTGYTREAKQCLVSSAQRGDQEYVAVVLGAIGQNVWTDSTSLLDYGFNNFTTYKQKNAGTFIRDVEVEKGTGKAGLITEKDFFYTVPRNEQPAITEKVEISSSIEAPVRKGQVLGRIRFFQEGKAIGSVNLTARNDVEVKKFAVGSSVGKLSPVWAGGLLIIFYVAWNVRKRRRRKRNRVWINRNAIR